VRIKITGKKIKLITITFCRIIPQTKEIRILETG
jgi:hypothetical protein